MTAQATFAATLVDEWVRCGVTDAVVAPGSRSTPLALALAADGRLRLHVHHDERSAAFLALGLGLASRRPAIVLTTSGTAAVELHPAVVEAHQAGVPLLACTADRPPELHHVGAPQTVEQGGLFAGAVRWATEPGVAREEAAGTWRSLAARAVAEATGRRPGPVHLNLAFVDPLAAEPGELPPGRPDGEPWHRALAGSGTLADGTLEGLAAPLATERGVIVAGLGSGEPAAVHDLATALGWPVLADPRSGCRTPGPTTVAAADALLRHPGFADRHRPRAVLRLGAPPASKVLAQWLATSGADQVVVDPAGTWWDPERTAAAVVAADPTDTCRRLAALARATGDPGRDWLEAWSGAEAAAQAALGEALGGHDEATEPGVARSVLAALPPEATLVVSSSMPVRDLEWYGAPRTGVEVVGNRGANGIDGVTSTAVGVALATAGPTALLIGDVALLHDTNALLGLAGRGAHLAIVVVDNRGGGIFSFLPQAGSVPPERFELLFGTPHTVDLVALAAVHGIPSRSVTGAGEVAPAVQEAVAAGGVRLVVIPTDRAANVRVHDELHAAVARALDQPT